MITTHAVKLPNRGDAVGVHDVTATCGGEMAEERHDHSAIVSAKHLHFDIHFYVQTLVCFRLGLVEALSH